MLLDIIKEGITATSLIKLGLYIIIILISLSVHELAHGYVAYRCGDATARNLGRLTLNPLAHLDPIGTIMMLVFGFGYAKPVPVNPRNFNHYKRDLCFVSFAGPVSNLLLALFWALVLTCSLGFMGFCADGMNLFEAKIKVALESVDMFYFNSPDGFQMYASDEFVNSAKYVWLNFCMNFVYANIGLAIFNLIPIPPLDGSRIVSTILPGKWAFYYLKYEQYIMIAMFVLLWQGAFTGILTFLSDKVMWAFVNLGELIFTPILNLF